MGGGTPPKRHAPYQFELDGVHPGMRRPCILCWRANVTDTYLRIRKARNASNTCPEFIINWFSNPVSFSPALRSGKSLTKNKLFACGKSFTKKMGALEPRKGNPVFGQAFAAGEKLG